MYLLLLLLIVWRVASKRADILDVDEESHEDYLAKFKTALTNRLQEAIEKNLQNDPDCLKGRKKTVQVQHQKRYSLISLPHPPTTYKPNSLASATF